MLLFIFGGIFILSRKHYRVDRKLELCVRSYFTKSTISQNKTPSKNLPYNQNFKDYGRRVSYFNGNENVGLLYTNMNRK